MKNRTTITNDELLKIVNTSQTKVWGDLITDLYEKIETEYKKEEHRLKLLQSKNLVFFQNQLLALTKAAGDNRQRNYKKLKEKKKEVNNGN